MNGREHIIWSERWRLAALQPGELARIGLMSAVFGLAYVIFHLQGNTTDINAYGRSALMWMVERWRDSGPALGGADYSHGAFIPAVSAYLIWRKRKVLASAPKAVSAVGLGVVVAALLLHWLGARAQQVRLSLMGLIALMWGIPFYVYGWQVAKHLMFPAAYLIFCIPLNFLDSISVPLRLLMTAMTTFLLNGIGIPVERTGTAIGFISGTFDFDVADPCSGLRSLLAMTAITAAYAYITQRTLLKKWILFLSSIPIAIIGNMFRIMTIALIAQVFSAELAMKMYHDFSGYLIFLCGTMLMISFGAFLNLNYREVWRKWKRDLLLSPTS